MMSHAWNPSTLEVEAEKSGIQDEPQVHVEFEANQARVNPDLGKKWSKIAVLRSLSALYFFFLPFTSSVSSFCELYMHKYIYMHIYNVMIFVFIYISKSSSFLNYNQNWSAQDLSCQKKCLTDVIFEN